MAGKTDPRNDPSTVSSAYDVMSPRWFIVEQLLGGTESMRAAGEALLPRHPRERSEAYHERLSRAVLYNLFELTVDLLAGKPFTEEISWEDGMPATMAEYAEDIDLQGNNLTRFGYEVFRTALAKSLTHVLADAPAASDEVVTLADERDLGIRPYLVHIEPENLIFAEAKRIKSEEVLTHVRFRHTITSRDGFAEVHEEFIRVLDLMVMPPETEGGEERMIVRSAWWYKPTTGRDKGKWVEDMDRRAVIQAERIPLATFYTNRTGFMMGKPPLIDLAYMNVEHWQSYADQTNILTVTRFPLLASSGVSEYDSEATVISPREMLIAEDPAARFYYVEHSGAAISAGEKSIKDLEARMASYGSSLLQKRPDRETASARAASEESVTSPLQRMVTSFSAFLRTVLGYMHDLDGGASTDIPKIRVRDDFTNQEVDAVELQTLQVAVREGVISREGFLTELIRKKVLSPDFDVKADLALLKAELEVRALIAAADKGMSGVQDPIDPNAVKEPANEDPDDEDPEEDEPPEA